MVMYINPSEHFYYKNYKNCSKLANQSLQSQNGSVLVTFGLIRSPWLAVSAQLDLVCIYAKMSADGLDKKKP